MLRDDVACLKRTNLGQNKGHGNGVIVSQTIRQRANIYVVNRNNLLCYQQINDNRDLKHYT